MPEGPSFMTDCHMDLYFSRPGFIFPSELRVQQQNNIRFSKEMKTESEHARQNSIRSPEILDTLFRLHLCRFRRGIWPWIQHDLCPGHWRFYWNPTPGGVLRIGKQEIPLEPEFFYLIPPFLRFSTFARAPFDQFFVHFNLSVKRPGIDRIFRLPTDPETVSRIRRFIADSGEWENLQMRTLLVHAILSEVLLRLPEEMFRLERCPDPRIAKICRLLEEPEGASGAMPNWPRFCTCHATVSSGFSTGRPERLRSGITGRRASRRPVNFCAPAIGLSTMWRRNPAFPTAAISPGFSRRSPASLREFSANAFIRRTLLDQKKGAAIPEWKISLPVFPRRPNAGQTKEPTPKSRFACKKANGLL